MPACSNGQSLHLTLMAYKDVRGTILSQKAPSNASTAWKFLQGLPEQQRDEIKTKWDNANHLCELSSWAWVEYELGIPCAPMARLVPLCFQKWPFVFSSLGPFPKPLHAFTYPISSNIIQYPFDSLLNCCSILSQLTSSWQTLKPGSFAKAKRYSTQCFKVLHLRDFTCVWICWEAMKQWQEFKTYYNTDMISGQANSTCCIFFIFWSWPRHKSHPSLSSQRTRSLAEQSMRKYVNHDHGGIAASPQVLEKVPRLCCPLRIECLRFATLTLCSRRYFALAECLRQ